MRIPAPLRDELAFAIERLLNSWRVWCGVDQIRALYVGYDCANGEIDISLLTDNEPYLGEQNMDGFSTSVPGMENVWPTADWRLSKINCPGLGHWHDAAGLLGWMTSQAESASTDELLELDADLKGLLISIVTGDEILALLSKFRRVAIPLSIRVEQFNTDEPFDFQLTERIGT